MHTALTEPRRARETQPPYETMLFRCCSHSASVSLAFYFVFFLSFFSCRMRAHMSLHHTQSVVRIVRIYEADAAKCAFHRKIIQMHLVNGVVGLFDLGFGSGFRSPAPALGSIWMCAHSTRVSPSCTWVWPLTTERISVEKRAFDGMLFTTSKYVVE